jgi:hypothetical protein
MLDRIFSLTTLDILLPHASLAFPPTDVDEWLKNSTSKNRKQVFYGGYMYAVLVQSRCLTGAQKDEQLSVILVARIKPPQSESDEPEDPPPDLIQLLLHLQLGLEALYVPSGPPPPAGRTSFFNAPPRSVSFGKVKPKAIVQHTPSTSSRTPPPPAALAEETPKQGASASPEGALLSAVIWGQGQNTGDEELEQFSLNWSASEQLWVAMFKFTMTVCERDGFWSLEKLY